MVNMFYSHSKNITIILIFLGILACWTCTKPKIPKADTVFVNGHILTMDESLPEAEAFAVKDGYIFKVGTSKDILKSFPTVKIVDLNNKTVMPGIVESHGHLLTLGQSFIELNLEGTKTSGEAVKKVEEHIRNSSRGEWIIGWGWDEGSWAANYPNSEALDRISRENPVYLRGLHGFASWVNSRALELAGIDSSTKNPDDGEIIKDSQTGIPTGILTNRAQEFIETILPPMSQSQIEKALKLAQQECLKYGLTSVHEARVSQQMLDAFHSLKERGELDIRIYAMLDWKDEDLIDSSLEKGPEIDPDHLLTVRCVGGRSSLARRTRPGCGFRRHPKICSFGDCAQHAGATCHF